MIETILDNLRHVFEGNDAKARQHAQAQLFEFQKTQQAWQFAFEVLHNQQMNTSVQFFAAQTLQIKINRDWPTFPPEKHLELRDGLREEMYTWRGGMNIVTRKIATAVAAYCIKTMTSEWKSAIQDIISWSQASSDNPIWFIECSLELLTVLPEEALRVHLSSEDRAPLNSALASGFPDIMTFLDACLEQNVDKSVRIMAAKCLQSWIQFEIPVSALPPLISRIMTLLTDNDTFEAASEVLHELVCHPQSYHYEKSLCDGLLPQLTTGWFMEKYNEAYRENDEDTIATICKLMVAFGEQFTSYVIDHVESPHVQNLLQIIFQCTDYPGYFAADEDISEMTMNFWFVFQDTLQDVDLPINPQEYEAIQIEMSEENLAEKARMENAALEQENLQKRKEIIENIYARLINVLLRKAALPDDQTFSSQWNSETRNRFKTYRRDLADAMIYCYYLLGDKSLAILLEILTSQLSGSHQNLEATLFGIRAIAESVSFQETSYLPRILSLVLGLKQTSSHRLLQTTLLLLGSYSNWIATQNQETINQAFSFVMNNLAYVPASNGVDVTSAAFKTFRNMCDNCRKSLVSLVEPLVQMFVNAESAQLLPAHKSVFVEGLASVIQAMTPDAQGQPVSIIITMIVKNIEQYLSKSKTDQVKLIIIESFKNINAVFRGIQFNEEDPDTGAVKPMPFEYKLLFYQNYSSFLSSVWNIIMPICDAYGDDDDIIQQIVSFLDISLLAFKSSIPPTSDGQQSLHNVFIFPSLSQTYCESFANLIYSRINNSNNDDHVKIAWTEGISSIINVFGEFADLTHNVDSLAMFQQKNPNLTEQHFNMCKNISNTLILVTRNVLNAACKQLIIADGLPLEEYDNSVIFADDLLHQITKHLDTKPDFVESFLSLVEVCVKRHAVILFHQEMALFMKSLGVIILASINLKERQAFRSTVQLVNTIINLGNHNDYASQQAKALLRWMGVMFLHIVIDGISYELPRTSLHAISELLYKFIIAFPDESKIYIRQSMGLSNISHPTIHALQSQWGHGIKADKAQREQFSKMLLSTRQLKRFRDIVKDFATRTRETFPMQFL